MDLKKYHYAIFFVLCSLAATVVCIFVYKRFTTNPDNVNEEIKEEINVNKNETEYGKKSNSEQEKQFKSPNMSNQTDEHRLNFEKPDFSHSSHIFISPNLRRFSSVQNFKRNGFDKLPTIRESRNSSSRELESSQSTNLIRNSKEFFSFDKINKEGSNKELTPKTKKNILETSIAPNFNESLVGSSKTDSSELAKKEMITREKSEIDSHKKKSKNSQDGFNTNTKLLETMQHPSLQPLFYESIPNVRNMSRSMQRLNSDLGEHGKSKRILEYSRPRNKDSEPALTRRKALNTSKSILHDQKSKLTDVNLPKNGNNVIRRTPSTQIPNKRKTLTGSRITNPQENSGIIKSTSGSSRTNLSKTSGQATYKIKSNDLKPIKKPVAVSNHIPTIKTDGGSLKTNYSASNYTGKVQSSKIPVRSRNP